MTVAPKAIPNGSRPTAAISAEQAGRIAVTRVGGGHVTGVERELEHGRLEWKVRVVDGARRADVRVDARTGAVTRLDDDSRDGGRDDRGEDDHGDARHDRGDDHGGDRRGGDDGHRGGHDDPAGHR
ncbi:hypothetical protein GCM10023317_67530 [Actinopolymorpha pittospori]